MIPNLYYLQSHCERADLPVSCVEIVRNANLMNERDRRIKVGDVQIMASTLAMHVEDECSTKLFFALEADRKKYFNSPTNAYEDAIKRFPDVTDDIIESSKCFALGRNAASVFHSTQAIETGMLYLGKFLSVKDPKPGFVATVNELNRIVKLDPQKRSAFELQHYAFIEQIHASVISLQNAWRHKISHVAGRLTLMTADFSEEVAEEILMATRAFMRRLATEMPITNA
jgi:hypothetical protein